MRQVATGILALGAVLSAILGWQQIWHVLREARELALVGWLIGMMGLALLIGRRKNQTVRRMAWGAVLAALGLALMSVPTDARGLLTGIRVGYAGSLLAVLPHCWRLYHSGACSSADRDSTGFTKGVL